MKKSIILFIVSFLIFNFIFISLEPFTILQPARAMRYNMETSISFTDASFIGENEGDHAGYGATIAGDINGDGYDDILIGAHDNDNGGPNTGQTYLIFGSASGWSMDTNISNADASFIGENWGDLIGFSVAGAGDVNGDGFDDILIGTIEYTGKVYLIFGKDSGWAMNTSLLYANASFIGEASGDWAGYSIAGAGDVNGDGFDDILISAPKNNEGGSRAGQIYLIFGKESGWSMNTDLSNVNASFIGENPMDYAAESVAGAGDVNGDGFDDILIGAYENNEGGNMAGQVYLIFGNDSGWAMDTSLSNASASFIGEDADNWAGYSVAGAGNVNGDEYDDILIGARNNDEGDIDAGQAYLIFGKESGWSNDTDLADADASFIGEYAYDVLGWTVAGGGDVNGDDFDDLLICGFGSDEGGTNLGQIYLILGKASGWSMDTNITSADSSFIGETDYGWTGFHISCAGDVNGDGYDDILIGASFNKEGGLDAGQVYLIFPQLSLGSSEVYSVKVYSDVTFTNEINITEIGDTVYVELTALDENSSHMDNAAVNVSSTKSSREGFWLYLLETGANTGRYRGSFKISNRTHRHLKLINATIGENIIISSVMDSTKSTMILVSTPVQLRPLQDKTLIIEDGEYFMHYWNFGYNTVTAWTFESNGSWLEWDDLNHDLTGTPNNDNVGTFWVRLNVTDGLGNYDEHNFNITVNNTPPNITNKDVLIALEDEPYYVDYTCTDDSSSIITWQVETDASWLSLNASSGELSGTPTNNERGSYDVNVSVDDGNGGEDWSNFKITVTDTNDAPVIITDKITTVLEDEVYFVDYEAIDIDDPPIFEWHLESNASWLKIDNNNGILSGIPNNNDVGIYYVNITVEDIREGFGSQNFTLEVLNVNDPPEWVTVPTNIAVNEGELYIFDVNASDIDSGDILTYNISSKPATDITIDNKTGLIEWIANIYNFEAFPYILEVSISLTDSEVTIWTSFEINVISNLRPTTRLLSPADGSLASAIGIELKWEGQDIENEPLSFNVYFGKDLTLVSELRETVRVLHNTNDTSYIPKSLDIGIIYYWTVIPFDGRMYGECLDGIFSFKVNNPPTISNIPKQKCRVDDKFKYELETYDANQEDLLNLVFSLESAPEGMFIEPNTGLIIWMPKDDHVGKHIVKVQVSDGKDVTNTTFEIEVTDKLGDFTSIISIYIIVTTSIIILIIVNIGITGTEVGKFKFYAFIFVPLYNKLHPEKIFDNYTRDKINGYIRTKPGENFSTIKNDLKLNIGTLVHHARILEKEGHIDKKRDGFYMRFYPKGMKAQYPDSAKLNEIQENLIKIIRSQPGITQLEIINLLKLSQQVVSYNLLKLTRNNIIKIEQNGRENRYFIDSGIKSEIKVKDDKESAEK